MITIGIDYSITSPGVCVHNGESWDVSNCDFYFFHQKKKEPPAYVHDSIHWIKYDRNSCDDDFDHFNRLSDSVCGIIDTLIIKTKEKPHIFIEGYSYGSSGSRVFQIAENTAILKQKIYERGLGIDIVPPTVIKKYATGKGTANKETLEEHFIGETAISFREILSQTPSQYNPSSDLIDAYYICKYGHHHHCHIHGDGDKDT